MILRFTFSILLSIFLGTLLIGQKVKPVKPHMVKGVCWETGDSIAAHNFDHLVENNVTWFSQIPFSFQDAHDSPLIHSYRDNHHWGESVTGLIHTANLAKEQGISVMLKPHIWLRNRDGKWRSDIEMNSEEEWEQWFCSYSDFILYYAKVAEEGRMEAFCIGTELLIPTTRFPERWIALIKEVRTIYHGKLIYAANFYKEYEGITFWDHLDAIGIQGYFPLADENNPSLESLKKGWEPHIKKMKAVSSKYGKPIVFTEVGYRNTADAAIEPWLWPRQVDDNYELSDQTQAICYQAMFESLWKEDWFNGVFIWKWFHAPYDKTQEEYYSWRKERKEESIKNGRWRWSHVVFSPQEKQAEKVMSGWFGKTTID